MPIPGKLSHSRHCVTGVMRKTHSPTIILSCNGVNMLFFGAVSLLKRNKKTACVGVMVCVTTQGAGVGGGCICEWWGQHISTHSEHRHLCTYTMTRTAGHQNKDNMLPHVSTFACHT